MTIASISPKKQTNADIVVVADLDKLIQINLGMLLPQSTLPCTIFVYHNERFESLFKEGEEITIEMLRICKLDYFGIGFIYEAEIERWQSWIELRYLSSQQLEYLDYQTIQGGHNTRLGDKGKKNRAAFATYAFSCFEFNKNKTSSDQLILETNREFNEICDDPFLNWYFELIPDESIANHAARVAYLCLLFTKSKLPPMPERALRFFIISCIIHELQFPSNQILASEHTLETILKKNIILPAKIQKIISDQDEYYNGSGGPKGLTGSEINVISRIFSPIHFFDTHYRESNAPSRKQKYQLALGKTIEAQDKFDPNIYKLFSDFIEKIEYLK